MQLGNSCATVAHNQKPKGDALPQSQATPQARVRGEGDTPVKQLFSLPLCIFDAFDVSLSWHLSSSDDSIINSEFVFATHQHCMLQCLD